MLMARIHTAMALSMMGVGGRYGVNGFSGAHMTWVSRVVLVYCAAATAPHRPDSSPDKRCLGICQGPLSSSPVGLDSLPVAGVTSATKPLSNQTDDIIKKRETTAGGVSEAGTQSIASYDRCIEFNLGAADDCLPYHPQMLIP